MTTSEQAREQDPEPDPEHDPEQERLRRWRLVLGGEPWGAARGGA